MSQEIPKYSALFNPVSGALKELGGSGSVKEIDSKVIEMMNFPEKLTQQLHDPETGNQTESEYRLAWARTYLKKYGLIENSSRGIWALTKSAEDVHEVDPKVVIGHAKGGPKRSKGGGRPDNSTDLPQGDGEAAIGAEPWRDELHRLLNDKLGAAAFERLVQRLLRESGFIQVVVTGRAGDGGIDGKGIARIYMLMRFHVIFQCKRYKGSVTSSEIRDFRGAMVGRADKGLFITTGSFTKDAVKEATRDGAPPIDLLDGDQLAEKLKELGLGVKVEQVEKVTIGEGWFDSI